MYNALPGWYFKRKYNRLKSIEPRYDPQTIKERLNYYFRIDKPFSVPESAVRVGDFKKTRGTGYFLDLKEFLHYFKKDTRFAYHFGDETHINEYPTLFKARRIGQKSATSILFKLNKRRHFQWVNDVIPFQDKKDMLVWRGTAIQENRKRFVKEFHNKAYCDVGQTNKVKEDILWQKEFLSPQNHLRYKFIFCPEGYDVATNLKWVLSSNSICFMPKPTCETWFMEGKLKAGVHYVEVRDDFLDIEDRMNYYSSRPDEALQITSAANEFAKQFQDSDLEDILCIKVLEQYTDLSGQQDARKFL